MRRFLLERSEDVSGSSGVGVVAEGVEFTDGKVALRWRVEPCSTGFYDSIDHLELIHGHGGLTQVKFRDRYE